MQRKLKQKISFLFFIVFIGNQALAHTQEFEEFATKMSQVTTIEGLIKEKNKEYKRFLSTKNKFHLYNSKYVNYLIECQKGDVNKALSYLNYIIIDYKSKNTKQLIWINYYMAKTLRNIDAVKVAQKYSLQALNLAKKRKHLVGIEFIYEQLGLIYYKQKLFIKAAQCFRNAYLTCKKDPQKNNYSIARINDIGVCYRKMNDNEKALHYYNIAYVMVKNKKNKTLQDHNLIILLEGNIGGILSDMKQYDKAILLLEREINYYYAHPELLDICAARTLIDLIKIYEIKKDHKNLNKRLSDLIQLEKLRKDGDISLLVDQFLFEYYQRNKDQSNALKITNRLLEDIKKANDKTIEKLSLLSDLVYKQKIIQLQDNTRNKSKLLIHAVKEKEISQLVTYITILFFIIIFIFGFLFYRNVKKNMVKNAIIAKQNIQIVESINYSKKIQDALLPNINTMKSKFQNIFIYYQPKDIVSGDFYWHKNFDTHSVLACVDCTGHGVPGAFMSTIGSLAMDKITAYESLCPSQILSDLNDEIIRILRQQTDGEMQDGMDLSICIVDHVKNQISFSGARNGIIVVKQGKAQRYKADLLPVGGNYTKRGKPIERQFHTQTIDISSGDWIYMHTDGFIEQIGGANNVPMNYNQYEKLLISLTNIDKSEEKNAFLTSELERWRGLNERLDDILIMGFQII